MADFSRYEIGLEQSEECRADTLDYSRDSLSLIPITTDNLETCCTHCGGSLTSTCNNLDQEGGQGTGCSVISCGNYFMPQVQQSPADCPSACESEPISTIVSVPSEESEDKCVTECTEDLTLTCDSTVLCDNNNHDDNQTDMTVQLDLEKDSNLTFSQSETVTNTVDTTEKHPLVFEVSFDSETKLNSEMPKKVKGNLQEAFLQFRKKKQDDIRQERRRRDAILEANADPVRMQQLRLKIIQQAKKYFGVPYAKKYWAPNTPEYKSPIFLDCCGLVRQVIRDLKEDLGFRLGPWNQAYMFDTLPVTLKKEQMKPGDLVFMTGVYVSPKSKKQRHNMLHVEIWLGEGDRTIGARWNNGKVQIFNSYKFDPKSFHSEQYIFKSIDTWLMGICHSYCPKHHWRIAKYNPTTKSIFNVENEENIEDEKAEPDSEDEGKDEGKEPKTDTEDSNRTPGESCTSPDTELFLNLPSGQTTQTNSEADGITPRSQLTVSAGRAHRKDSSRKEKNSSSSGSFMSAKKWKIHLKPRTKSPGKKGSSRKSARSAVDPSAIDVKLVEHGHKVILDNHGATKARAGGSKTGSKGTKNQIKKSATSPEFSHLNSPASKQHIRKPTIGKSEPIKMSKVLGNQQSEMNYIPTNLPGRGNPTTLGWMPMKQREKRAGTTDCGSPANVLHRCPAWNLHKSQQHPSLSVVGSQNQFIPKNNSCPNLESSAMNFIFRTNTNFFKNGKEFTKSPEDFFQTQVDEANTPRDVDDDAESDSSDREKEIEIGIYSEEEDSDEDYDTTYDRNNSSRIEDCLIIRKSPCFNEAQTQQIRTPRTPSSSRNGATLRPLPPSRQQEIVSSRQVRDRESTFSCIKEEGSSIVPSQSSKSVSITVKNTPAIQPEQDNQLDPNLTTIARILEKEYSETLAPQKEWSQESSVYVKAGSDSEPDQHGTHSKIHEILPEQTALDSRQDTIHKVQDDERETEDYDELANTSFCSDGSWSELMYFDDARIPDIVEAKSELSCGGFTWDSAENEADGDPDTDDELDSALGLTALNHNRLSISSGLYALQGQEFNQTWDWLYSLGPADVQDTPEDIPVCQNYNIDTSADQITPENQDQIRKLYVLPGSAKGKRSNILPPLERRPSAQAVGGFQENQLGYPKLLHDQYIHGANQPQVFQENVSVRVAPPTREAQSVTCPIKDQGYFHREDTTNLLVRYVLDQSPRADAYTASSTPVLGACNVMTAQSFRTATESAEDDDDFMSSLDSSSIFSEDFLQIEASPLKITDNQLQKGGDQNRASPLCPPNSRQVSYVLGSAEKRQDPSLNDTGFGSQLLVDQSLTYDSRDDIDNGSRLAFNKTVLPAAGIGNYDDANDNGGADLEDSRCEMARVRNQDKLDDVNPGGMVPVQQGDPLNEVTLTNTIKLKTEIHPDVKLKLLSSISMK